MLDDRDATDDRDDHRHLAPVHDGDWLTTRQWIERSHFVEYAQSNFAGNSALLLSLVLVSVPELDERLCLRSNRLLYSRIHTRLHLGDAGPEDTAENLADHVAIPGATQDLFDGDALALVHEAFAGRLRDTDRIATETFSASFDAHDSTDLAASSMAIAL